jgi:hypothetical protein
MTYVPAEKRYDGASFNRCGRSGIVLPPISLGLWQNFGGVNVFETGCAVIRRAFDLSGVSGLAWDRFGCSGKNLWRRVGDSNPR